MHEPVVLDTFLIDEIYLPPIRIIQVLLGHGSLSTTARYTQVSTGLIRGTKSPLDRLTLEVVPPA